MLPVRTGAGGTATRFLASTPSAAAWADAGDCFEVSRGGGATSLHCLPGLINIGVQKAGTGELQHWLDVHPAVVTHGGEVHFFDGHSSTACTARQRGPLRLRYARFLWRRRGLQRADVRGRLLFEKTPAYFDQASPRLVACAVPSAQLLIMLRAPAERARSAYSMCQRELGADWCRAPFDEAVARILGGVDGASDGASGVVPRVNRRALRRSPHMRRMLQMGQYAVFLRRWLGYFPPGRVGILWLEQFKVDPFRCMRAVETFAHLPAHDFRKIATRNAAGLYVVGDSKSSSAATSGDAAAATAASRRRNASAAAHSRSSGAGIVALRAYYAPWQRRLRALVLEHNLTLSGLDLKRSPIGI